MGQNKIMHESEAGNNPAESKPNSPSRPPRPGAPGKSKGSKDNKDKKPGRIRKQAMPVLVMTGLIVGAFIIYSGVRVARQAIGPQAAKTVALPDIMGSINLGLPSGWKDAKMQNVAKASGRWGLGKPGSTKYAFFATRYPLRSVPGNSTQVQQMLNEAQRSLRKTGAQGQNLKKSEYKQGDLSGWKYHFISQGIDIQIWLILHNQEKHSALYQFACQSKPGAKGHSMRTGCQQSLNGLKFSKDQA